MHRNAPTQESLTPRRIVSELDQYIVGQDDAKRAVSIAMRNRWRRRMTGEEMSQEILPKNIVMIGPTGVGKTEIARRLAGLAKAPFVKVEASKFTEVGYYGRDVESMVRELVNDSLNMVQKEMADDVRPQAEKNAEQRLLDGLHEPETDLPDRAEEYDRRESRQHARERLREMLREGKLEDREVEIEVTEKPTVVQGVMGGQEELGFDMEGMLEQMMPSRKETRRMPVSEARDVLVQQEIERLIDKEILHRRAVERAQENGIIFIDEIDKVAGRESDRGPEVSREGVQRDMLPIVEGSSVSTRYGTVDTDHVLFIAAGAFTVSKPSDMIPELQGRFPIRVELDELTRDDFRRILVEPRNALTKQYKALLETEGVELNFREDAIDRISAIAQEVNENTESIGARRLQTVMEKLVEEVSFHAPEMSGTTVDIDAEYVDDRLEDLVRDRDVTRYIL
ncbi:MAG: ATP-dependent protease ATPase subunit HslU [Planctomycetota bacterium]